MFTTKNALLGFLAVALVTGATCTTADDEPQPERSPGSDDNRSRRTRLSDRVLAI